MPIDRPAAGGPRWPVRHFRSPAPMPAQRTLDLAIIGAGIAGVIHLHYARQAGLDALALEARDGIGGLWRELPAWQDIQISDGRLGDGRPAAGRPAGAADPGQHPGLGRPLCAGRRHPPGQPGAARAPCRRRLGAGHAAWHGARAPPGGRQRRPQHAADPAGAATAAATCRNGMPARCTSLRRWPAATCWWWAAAPRPST